MNERDFAVVVGISKYPGFGAVPNEPAHLRGPDRDAIDVYEWLTSEQGGGVRPEHAELICSSKFPETDDVLAAEPQLSRIQRAFQAFVLQAQQNTAAGKDRKIGRRLYIYMAGHGFAPSRYKGGLFLANATMLNTQNTYASGWLEWFQDTRCFDEFVLWMDCCMDREFTLLPEAIPLRMQGATGAPGPTMVAFAAPRPLRTIETEIDGRVRGVFTYTLLQGLKGAAADPQSLQVTARSVGEYLLNAMKDSMPPGDLENPMVAKEPEIVKADAQLVFSAAAAPAAQRYAVNLTLPGVADGTEVRLWAGAPPTAASLAVSAGTIEAQLPRGLYLVEVPAAGLRQGFEVSGSGPVEIQVMATSRGPAVRPAENPALFCLQVDPGNEAAEIFVIDSRFALVARGRGSLKMDQAYGLYKIKIRLERAIREEIILLDSDAPIDTVKAPQLQSSIPLRESDRVPAHQQTTTYLPRNIHVYAGNGAQIFMIVRTGPIVNHSDEAARVEEGVVLINSQGQVIADLRVHGERVPKGTLLAQKQVAEEPFTVCNVDVTPGDYFLRRHLAGGVTIEQSIVATEGWRTEVFLSQAPQADGDKRKPGRQCELLMRRLDRADIDARDPRYDQLMAAARIALADARKILSDKMRELLVTRFDDPIAGILGGHLLLIEAESNPDFKLDAGLEELDEVIVKLRKLAGNAHPDVESLSQCCRRQELRGTAPLSSPPVFVRSWQLAVAASRADRPLISFSLWERVRAVTSLAPYFVWAVDRKSRSSHADMLLGQLADAARVPEPMAKSKIADREAGVTTLQDLNTSASELHDDASQLGENIVSALAQQWGIPPAALVQLVKKRGKRKMRGVP